MAAERETETVAGLAVARGLAAGPVFIYRGNGEVPVPEYVVPFGREEAELLRLERARREVRRDLENLIAVLRERAGREDVLVFESHVMMLDDPMMTAETNRNVTVAHLNAEAALRRSTAKARERFLHMNDPYFRERVRDLDDVERRILAALAGFSHTPGPDLKTPSIVVADDLTPSETVQMPREMVLGFATDGGSTTSHVALLARALGIPAVAGLGDLTERVRPGETVLLDGNLGTVTIAPDDDARRRFEIAAAHQAAAVAPAADDRTPAGMLKDGTRVLLAANFHEGVPTVGLAAAGARSIGLYRSEYLWFNREIEPTEAEQFAAYRAAAELAATLGEGASLTVRSLDIGGDKLLKGISAKEANPFLGNRSIRYLLSHRDVMRTQLRAILRASAFGKLRLMHPMVSCPEELEAASEVLGSVKRELDDAGVAYDRALAVGIMVEVPAAALAADVLAPHVDFFSIGTNDLVQYAMAADRGNDAVANLYQPLHPAVLKLVAMTIAAAKANRLPVSVCGESASDPVLGLLWVAMGVDELSMSPAYIPVIARLLRRLTRADLDAYAAHARSLAGRMSAAEAYESCRGWLQGRIPDAPRLGL